MLLNRAGSLSPKRLSTDRAAIPMILATGAVHSHLVEQREDGSALIYIDRQLIHEVTSPQAFEGLRLADRLPWRREANLAIPQLEMGSSINLT